MTATKPSSSFARVIRALAGSLSPLTIVAAGSENTAWLASLGQAEYDFARTDVGIEHGRRAGVAGRAQNDRRALRPADVDERGVRRGNGVKRQPAGIALQPRIVIGHDDSFAGRVHQNRANRRANALAAPNEAAIDARLRQVPDNRVPDSIVSDPGE